MAWTKQATYIHSEMVPGRATAAAGSIHFVRVEVVSGATHLRTDRLEPEPCSANVISQAEAVAGQWRWDTMVAEPSSANVISPAEAVRRYWRWDTMPETMRRLA